MTLPGEIVVDAGQHVGAAPQRLRAGLRRRLSRRAASSAGPAAALPRGVVLKRRGAAMWLAGALVLVALSSANAESALTICHDYGCKVQEKISFDDAVFEKIGEMLRTADDAMSERYAISAAVARMYVEAGKQTPIWRDRGGDLNDEGEGQ